MRGWCFAFFMLIGACGQLPLDQSDSGAPDATSDVVDATVDVVTHDGAPDASVDAADGDADDAIDAIVEACTKSADAKETFDGSVDYDAATAPWGQSLANGVSFAGADTDSNGNIVLGGYSGAFFVQAIDAAGNLKWKAGPNANTSSAATAIAFDPWGDVIVAGENNELSLDLGNGAFGPGAFVAKYDAQGSLVWTYGPFAHTLLRGIRAQSNGNIVVVGQLMGSDDYGGGIVTSIDMSDVVLFRLSSCGKFIDQRSWGSLGEQEGWAVAVDSNDNVFIGGSFENALDFGGGKMMGPAAGSESYNLFIAKLDANLGYLHQMNTGGASSNTAIEGLVIDSTGSNVFVAGVFSGTANLGNGAMTAFGTMDALIGKLDSSLGYVWANHYSTQTGAGQAGTYAAVADPTGGVTAVGTYVSKDLDFGKGVLPTGQGGFVVRFDSQGVVKASYGSNDLFAQSVATRTTWPDVVIGGKCYSSMTLPSGAITCMGNGNAFAARLVP